MFEVHMSNHYFDWIVELEATDTTPLRRVAEIMEATLRQGVFLSSTEVLTILSKARKFVEASTDKSP